MGRRPSVVGAVTIVALGAGSGSASATPRGAARVAAIRDVEQHLRSVILPAGAYPVSGDPQPAPFPPFFGQPPIIAGAPAAPAWRFAYRIVPQADAKAVIARIAAHPPPGARVDVLAPHNVADAGAPRTIEHSAVFAWAPTAILTTRDVLVSAIARPDNTTAIQLAGEEFWSLPFYPEAHATLGASGTLSLSIYATGRHRVSVVVRDTRGRVLVTATRTVRSRGTLVHLRLPAAIAASLRRRPYRVIDVTTTEGRRHTDATVAYSVLRERVRSSDPR